MSEDSSATDDEAARRPAPGEFELGTDGPKTILVGIDGSDTSMRAGAYATGLARRQGSRLVVVYVARHPVSPTMAPYLEDGVQQTADELRDEVAAGAERVGVSAEFRVERGDPYVELTRIADETQADAVVVGASMQAGHRLIGSMATKMVRSGRWPVTVVP